MKTAVLAILAALMMGPSVPTLPPQATPVPAAAAAGAGAPAEDTAPTMTAVGGETARSKISKNSTLMLVKKTAINRSTSTASTKVATLGAKTLVLVTQTKGSSWARVQGNGKSGWIQSSKLATPTTPRYVSTTSIAPRAGIKSGRTIAKASKGYAVWGTGQSRSGYVQVHMFGNTGWVTAQSLKRVSLANYTTKRTTQLRASANAGKTLATVPKTFTIGTTTNAKNNAKTWVKVQYRSTTGWLATKDLKPASLSAVAGPAAGSYTDAAYASVLRAHVTAWCPGVNIRITKKAGEYYAESYPLSITIGRTGKNDPHAPDLKATVIHECGHIKQFKAYPSGFSKLVKRAEAINPRKDGRGIEHLADCMSDQMGAKRTGSLPDGSTYRAGYGGTCSATQKTAATALLKGKKPVGG